MIHTINIDNTSDFQKPLQDKIEIESLSPPSDDSIESAILPHIISSFTDNLLDENVTKHSNCLVDDLKSSLLNNSKITMLSNYPIDPTGEESGSYLVIDLGGSTLRVAVVNIDDDLTKDRQDRITIVIENKWIIENNCKTLDQKFFEYICEKIKYTLEKQDLIDLKSVIKTGITWSFPLETTDYNSGRICHVSKGYTIGEEIYNRDLKEVLESTLKEFDIEIDVRVIINDSLAVYSAGRFIDDRMKLALVLGTGFNICCSLTSNDAIHSDKILNSTNLFNSELSFFGHNLVADVATKYDAIIDARFSQQINYKPHMVADPANPRLFQPNEVMTSGRYLPELTRLIFIDLIENEEIFQNVEKSQLQLLYKEYDETFNGEIICFLTETDDDELIMAKFKSLYQWDISKSDVLIIKDVLTSIINRAAFVVATSIIGFFKLLNEFNDDVRNSEITVGFIGSVLSYFTNYRMLILEYIANNEEIRKMGITVNLKLIENSSIIGAAIGAACHNT